LLISAIFGKPLIQGNFTRSDNEIEYPSKHGITCLPNITAVKINKTTKEHLYAIFNLLTIKWEYCPSMDEETEIINFFARFYNEYYIDYMNDVFNYERKFCVYKAPFTWKLLRSPLREIAGIFNSDSRKTIKKILGKRLSNLISKMARSS
jgi:hypothetical protein